MTSIRGIIKFAVQGGLCCRITF